MNLRKEPQKMSKVIEEFGSMVFNDAVMRAKLPKEVYIKVRATHQNGKRMDIETANIVANAMKDWAIERGATHFTHWFQPMTGITAEKHDTRVESYSKSDQKPGTPMLSC